MRTIGRFAGDVLMVSGVLLLADAGATVTWQEPVSALLGQRAQADLARELDDKLSDAAFAAPRTHGPAMPQQARRFRRELRRGDAVARIELPSLKRRYVVVEGTDTATLRRGPAHYPATALPGEGRTVAVAGHRTTYGAPFRTIDRLRRGDRITLTLPYGRFTYRVEQQRIVAPSATHVVRDVGRERLVLTACHPLYSAAKRIVVFASLERADPLSPTELSSRDSRNSSRPKTSAPAIAVTSSQ
jgi:sortase A